MEIFLWSGSGQILLDTFSSTYPTVVAYVIDTLQSSTPKSFLSNMLYAHSIFGRTSLPMVMVWTKTDVKDHEFVTRWMTSPDSLDHAVAEDKDMPQIKGCTGLILEEFHGNIDVISRSL
jgi:GPN-loop GTPase